MDASPPVMAAQTHLSNLLFTPDRVFKLLRPVRLPFVDFTGTATRCAAATTEYEHNHRLSPDVYLGTADVVEDGRLSDRMIVMRRLPAEQALDRLLTNGSERRDAGDSGTTELIEQVGRYVASVHSCLPALHGQQATAGSLASVRRNWEDNFTAISPHVGSVIPTAQFKRVAGLARAYIAGRSSLFAERVDQGWVRDGHGDLRAEHVFVTAQGPRLIDCVAFDDDLRIADALADVAFLAMDLERLAGPGAAMTLMRTWMEFTNEHHPSSLAHFYVAYRAHVRCKIALLRHQAGDPTAADRARKYHDMAARHLEPARIRVVMVGGGPGTGKSTIAEHVAESLGAVWLRSDEVRKDVAHIAHDDHAFAPPGEGAYSAQVSLETLEELARQAKTLVEHGVSVVLDATWRSDQDRRLMRAIAADASADVVELCCHVPDSLAKERIARRMASLYNPSDATPELVDYIGQRFDPWPESVVIDTALDMHRSFEAARRATLAGADEPTSGVEPTADEAAEVDPVDTEAVAPKPARFTVDLNRLRISSMIVAGQSNR